MKYSLSAVLLAAILILHGCVTPQQRRQDYVDERPGLSAESKAAVLEGRVEKGMNAEDVLASWGEPDRKTVSYTRSGVTELWTYLTPIGQFKSGEVTLNITNGHLTGLTN